MVMNPHKRRFQFLKHVYVKHWSVITTTLSSNYPILLIHVVQNSTQTRMPNKTKSA